MTDAEALRQIMRETILALDIPSPAPPPEIPDADLQAMVFEPRPKRCVMTSVADSNAQDVFQNAYSNTIETAQ